MFLTIDQATNYVNAVERHLQTVNKPCVAHTNLSVRKGLGVSRQKVVASHFRKSSADSDPLEQKQQLLGLKTVKLNDDCPVRWNSTYEMICCASEQQAAVSAEKKLSRMELTTSKWFLLEKASIVYEICIVIGWTNAKLS